MVRQVAWVADRARQLGGAGGVGAEIEELVVFRVEARELVGTEAHKEVVAGAARIRDDDVSNWGRAGLECQRKRFALAEAGVDTQYC